MGPAEHALREAWPARTPARKCRGAIGVSLDEPSPAGPKQRRTYVFNPGPWTDATVAAALERRR
jgi:hypothetical protein